MVEMAGVFGIGVGLGLVGRFLMPGRHGLIKVVARDLRLLPRIAVGTVPGRVGVARVIGRDVPLRWAVGSGVAGAYAGYFAAEASAPASSLRWLATVAGAVVTLIVVMSVGAWRRTSVTRQLGIHGTATPA
jgi:hypothetical protein